MEEEEAFHINFQQAASSRSNVLCNLGKTKTKKKKKEKKRKKRQRDLKEEMGLTVD